VARVTGPPENRLVGRPLGQLADGTLVAFELTDPSPKPGPDLNLAAGPTPPKPQKNNQSLAERLVSYLQPGSSGRAPDPLTKAANGVFNQLSAALAAKLSPHGQWRSRLSLDSQGRLQGGADYLYPFLDSDRTLFFGQLGASLADQDRTLARLGLGQRFFPGEELAWGYNAFLDADLGRAHFRASLGLELWLTGLKVATNLYQGLGPWRPSRDYPNWPVRERVASGWDLRAEGNLPFWPSLAVTGAVTKWREPQVGSFDPDRREKANPAYTYGLAWSPWPALTVSLSQTRERGRPNQTSLGLTYSYRPGLGQAETERPLSPALRRHDFVDRDYQLPLAYQGRVTHRIRLLGQAGPGLYRFQVLDGFGRLVSGVWVSSSVADPQALILDPLTRQPVAGFRADAQGEFVALYQAPQPAPTPVAHQTDRGRGDFLITPAPLAGPTPVPPAAPDDQAYRVTLTAAQSPHFTFQLTRAEGEAAPHQTVLGATLSPAVPIHHPRTKSLAAAFETDEGGYFQLSLEPTLGYPQVTLALTPPRGEPVNFELPLPHELTLTASPDNLIVAEPTPVTLTILLNGQPLAAGAVVTLTSPAGVWAGLPTTANLDGQSQILLPELTALAPGQLSLQAEVAGQQVGPVYFQAREKGTEPGRLTLTASPDNLIVAEPTPVTLTILLNGQPLAAGAVVTLTGPAGAWAGLPTTANLDAQSQILLPELTALVPGQLSLQAEVAGQMVGPVYFQAREKTPEPGRLTLTAQPLTLPYGQKTLLTLQVIHNGQPLPAGETVTLTADPDLHNYPATATTQSNGLIVIPEAQAFRLGQIPLTLTSWPPSHFSLIKY
jgi:hypothetical protein